MGSNHRGDSVGWLVLLAALMVGCHQVGEPAAVDGRPPAAPWFEDITEQVGLDFVHDAGAIGGYLMPQIVGSGVGLFDFNNNGRLDIYLVHNGGAESGARNRLFEQLPDGRFEDVSAGSGLDVAGYGMGVAIGDVNNDGWPDVLLTEYGGPRLFLNNGNGTFSEVTVAAGLDNPLWAVSACFLDYDRDGWLDLVVVNYVDYDPSWPCTAPSGTQDYCSPKVFTGVATRLFRNLGRQSTSAGDELQGAEFPLSVPLVQFEDVSVAAGLAQKPGPGLGVVCADFNGDGWPDILVANDGFPNHLWINEQDGTFSEQAVARGIAYNGLGKAEADMGIALGDVQGNGLLDVFITHLTSETNTLWKQEPQGLFQDQTIRSGLASAAWRGTGFGTVVGDFDQDGALDLAVVNGRVEKGPRRGLDALGAHWSQYAERNLLFRNDGSGRFEDLSPDNAPLCGTPNVARGLAVGDIDGDGALDLLVTTVGGRARLYRNVVGDRGHWLMVRAVDPALRRDAYGAEVTVHGGGRSWLRLINPGGSYLSSSDPRAHFGLGEVKRVDRLDIRWPDGTEESFAGCDADQVLVLRKGEGTPEEEDHERSP